VFAHATSFTKSTPPFEAILRECSTREKLGHVLGVFSASSNEFAFERFALSFRIDSIDLTTESRVLPCMATTNSSKLQNIISKRRAVLLVGPPKKYVTHKLEISYPNHALRNGMLVSG